MVPNETLAQRFGALVRDRRNATGLTQVALAESIGFTQAAVSAWESGDSVPTLPAILAICGRLQITLHELQQLRGDEAA